MNIFVFCYFVYRGIDNWVGLILKWHMVDSNHYHYNL